MKNKSNTKYQFLSLDHKGLLDETEKQLVFEQTNAIVKLNLYSYPSDIINAVKNSFSEQDEIFVMHNYRLHKGKLVRLLGNIALTNKSNLISFLEQEIAKNDLRTFRILKSKDADFVLEITDENAIVLYRKK